MKKWEIFLIKSNEIKEEMALLDSLLHIYRANQCNAVYLHASIYISYRSHCVFTRVHASLSRHVRAGH